MNARRSRGYRNRNPGNIEYSARNRWRGQVGPEPAGRFAVFESHAYGIRALAVLLRNYQRNHGLRTIRQVVERWAPYFENDTDAYVRAVANRTGFLPRKVLNLETYAHLAPLVAAIIHHELGGQPYSEAEIAEGLAMAGVAP
jgi:hypothetical protein